MADDTVTNLKKNIIAIGRLMWEKDLATGLNGNISIRVDENRCLITATRACLGLLQEPDIVLTDMQGQRLEGEAQPSSERPLHLDILRAFPGVSAVIHTHTVFTNAYFIHRRVLEPQVFETRFSLGSVEAIVQDTPTVTQTAPVIDKLRYNNIVVLQNHGSVAVGNNLFDCFLLIESLEDAARVDAIGRLYAPRRRLDTGRAKRVELRQTADRRHTLFSDEHVQEMVRMLNRDKLMREAGQRAGMALRLEMDVSDEGAACSLEFKQGAVTPAGRGGADIGLSASRDVWSDIFNGRRDPFVSISQKRMTLRGDFARLSALYVPLSRMFALFRRAPVMTAEV